MSELLALPEVTFWGDLDPEGLRIFQRLRHSVPGIQLSALYAPMIERLEAEGGHPLHVLTGKAGQRQAGNWIRGLDQEALDDTCVAELGDKSLDESLAEDWLSRITDPHEEAQLNALHERGELLGAVHRPRAEERVGRRAVGDHGPRVAERRPLLGDGAGR